MSQTANLLEPWLQWQRAAIDEATATVGRMSLLPTLWERARNIRKGASASEVVYEEDRLKLLHYTSDKKPRFKTPLVFMYALVNRPYILDLKKGRSVVPNFVAHGFGTHLVYWSVPTSRNRHPTPDAYIT